MRQKLVHLSLFRLNRKRPLEPLNNAIFTFLIFSAALLYSAVGHGGASGYLAVMALFMLPPAVMKPTALVLNVLVASIATYKYARAGSFHAGIFWRLALASVPFAFLGGWIELPGELYRPLVGLVLLYAALRSLLLASSTRPLTVREVSPTTLALAGAGIGLLSGLTGVGGGIFLSPLLVFFQWTDIKKASGIAAAFILVNSLAGLVGHLSRTPTLPAELPIWALAAAIGGYIGAEFGSRRLANRQIARVLALVLLVAGCKMIFT